MQALFKALCALITLLGVSALPVQCITGCVNPASKVLSTANAHVPPCHQHGNNDQHQRSSGCALQPVALPVSTEIDHAPVLSWILTGAVVLTPSALKLEEAVGTAHQSPAWVSAIRPAILRI